MDISSTFASVADGLTAASAAYNCAALLARRDAERSPARRNAVAVLALINAGIALQAAFAQALYTAHRIDAATAPFFAPGPWLASRLMLLAGTLLLSALILRSRPR